MHGAVRVHSCFTKRSDTIREGGAGVKAPVDPVSIRQIYGNGKKYKFDLSAYPRPTGLWGVDRSRKLRAPALSAKAEDERPGRNEAGFYDASD